MTKLTRNLIITGATGYLGAHICNKIIFELNEEADSYDQIYLLDRSLKLDRLVATPESLKGRIHFMSCDLENFELPEALADSATPPVVLHLANLTSLESEKRFLNQINEHSYLVYFSSAAVYGESTGDSGHSEDSALNPISSYGEHKIAVEELIKDRFKSHLILRIANPYGEEFNSVGVIKSFEEQIKTNGAVEIFQESGGTQIVRDFVEINKLSSKLGLLLGNKAQGTYNLGSGEGKKLSDLAIELAKKQNKEIEIKETGYKDGDIKVSILNIAKLNTYADALPNQMQSTP